MMARSWRSQIADEVRATSMMKPRPLDHDMSTAALSTAPAADGLAVVGWRGGKDDGSRKYTEIKRVAEIWADQNLTVIPLVRADQAQSALAAVMKERDALAFGHRAMADFVRPRIPADQDPEQAESLLAWMGMIVRLEERGDKAVARAETAEAEVKRLTEANEQLRRVLERAGHFVNEHYAPAIDSEHDLMADIHATLNSREKANG